MAVKVNMAFMKQCPYCGNAHNDVCHRVSAIEYFPDGIIKRVELNDGKLSHEQRHEIVRLADAANSVDSRSEVENE